MLALLGCVVISYALIFFKNTCTSMCSYMHTSKFACTLSKHCNLGRSMCLLRNTRTRITYPHNRLAFPPPTLGTFVRKRLVVLECKCHSRACMRAASKGCKGGETAHHTSAACGRLESETSACEKRHMRVCIWK